MDAAQLTELMTRNRKSRPEASVCRIADPNLMY
jgi:hypothetical protein